MSQLESTGFCQSRLGWVSGLAAMANSIRPQRPMRIRPIQQSKAQLTR